MKNHTKGNGIFITCLSFIMFIVLGIAVSFGMGFADNEPEFKLKEGSKAISDSFNIGDRLVIPEYEIVANGKAFPAEHILFLPDGNTYNGNEYPLSTSGKHEILYQAEFADKLYEQRLVFFVNDPLYEIKGENGSNAYWGTTEYDGQGIITSLMPGDTFYFNKPFKLSETASTNFIKFYNLPNFEKSYDGDIIIVLTDAADSSNKLYIRVRKYPYSDSWADIITYVNTGFDGENWYDLREPTMNASNKTGIYDEDGYEIPKTLNARKDISTKKYYIFDTNSQFYGTEVEYSSVGTPLLPKDENGVRNRGTSKDMKDYQIWLTYDPDEMSLYSKNGKLVMDFDGSAVNREDPSIIEPYFADTWRGFESDEVYISIYGQNYKTNSINLVITEIGGYKTDDLLLNNVKDNDKPNISVDFAGYNEETVPNAIVGSNYSVFNATAEDKISGELPVNIRVYKSYYSNKPVLVPIVEGKFTADSACSYYIEYSATDNSGNKTVKVVAVEAVLERTSPLTAQTVGYVSSVEAAECVKIIDGVTINGAIGNSYWYLKVVHKNSGKEYLVNNEYGFTPLYIGDYSVTLYYGDYIEEKSIALSDLKVSSGSNLMLVEKPVFERYYIVNGQYAAENVYVYGLSENEPEKLLCNAFYKENDGNFIAISDNIFTVANCNTIQFKYEYNGKTAYISDIFPVVDVGFNDADYGASELIVENFFATVGADKETDEDGITFTSTGTESVVDFVKKIQVKSFDLTFTLYESDCNFNEFSITLTGNKNGEKIEISFIVNKTNGYLYYSVNGSAYSFYGKILDVNNAYAEPLKVTVTISYSNGTLKIKDGKGEKLDFSGFDGDMAYLSLKSIRETDASVKFSVNKINSQVFSSSISEDSGKPQIIFEQFKGKVTIGDVILIKSAVMADIFDTICFTSFNVKTPNGNYAVAKDGTRLQNADYTKDYYIEITEYGVYTVSYVASDRYNSRVISYVIRSEDCEPPVISLGGFTFSGTHDNSLKSIKVKTGSVVIAESFMVKDNISEQFETYIVCKNTNGKFFSVGEDMKVSVDEAGSYILYYVAIDEAGNTSIASYTIFAEN